MKIFHQHEEHNRKIRSIFSRIAGKYDFMNQVISFGQANAWGWQAIRELNVGKNEKILDLGTGSGDLAIKIKNTYPGTFMVGVDLTPEMIKIARKRDKKGTVYWIIADALHLPFDDHSYHKIISAYLLRNVPDLSNCLNEQHRLIKEQGQVTMLETTPPVEKGIGLLVRSYINIILPFLGRILANDYQAYKYLASTTARFYHPEEIKEYLSKMKFSSIQITLRMFHTIMILSAKK